MTLTLEDENLKKYGYTPRKIFKFISNSGKDDLRVIYATNHKTHDSVGWRTMF